MITSKRIGILRPAIYYALFTVVILASIYFLSINPMLKEKQRLSNDIAALQDRVQEQQILTPVYTALAGMLEPDIHSLPGYPAPGFFPQAQGLDDLMAGLRQAALDTGLREVVFAPDLRSLDQNPEVIPVRGEFSGDYFNFREFMLNLVSGPNFKDMEVMEINQTPQGSIYILRVVMAF